MLQHLLGADYKLGADDASSDAASHIGADKARAARQEKNERERERARVKER